MTTAFFLLSLMFAWLSYNLYRPIYSPPQPATFSFITGWLTGELAVHHILWQSLLVLLFAWGGAVSGFWGMLGLGLCLVAWAGMGYFYLSGNEARYAVEDAMAEGLGADFRSQIDPELLARVPRSLNTEALKRPFAVQDPEVEVIKDVAFGDFDQKLDIRRSWTSEDNMPVLLQIHGGAWTEKLGSKNEQAIPLMNQMAKRDWICVASSYRLSPKATFPEHIIDCKQAVAWIKENIADYGGDPDFVVVTGGSAGGHLSSLLALTANDPEFQPGFEDVDTTLQGAIPFYGPFDMTDSLGRSHNNGLMTFLESSVIKKSLNGHEQEYEAISPLKRIHEKAPPFMIIHGDKDTLVPVEMGQDFANELRRVSKNPVIYAEIEGGQHAFDMFASPRSEHVKHGVETFLHWLYSKR